MGGGPRGSRQSYVQAQNPNTKITDYVQQPSFGYTFQVDSDTMISYHTADTAQVSLLRYQLQDDRFKVHVNDYTVTKPYSSNWKYNVSVNNIMPASHIIVYIGSETHKRPSVTWEINDAHSQGKKVIGVRPKGSGYKIPKALIVHGDNVINWNMEEISYELTYTWN